VRAELLPQAGGTATYQRTTANFVARPSVVPRVFPSSGVVSSETFNFWNTGLTVSELVWDFGRTTGRWDQAKSAAKAEHANASASRQQVVLGVRTAFFTARANRALIGVALEAVENQRRHLVQVQGFVEVGTRPDIDLLQVRTDEANARVQLIQAENGYETAKAQLNVAMGTEGDTAYEVADDALPPIAGEDEDGAALITEALRARPELQRAEEQVRAQEAAVGAARGGWWPSVTASTAVTDAGQALGDLTWNWNAQVALNWPLFQGLFTTAQIREFEAGVRAVEADRDTQRQQIRLEVEQARLAVRASKAGLAAATEALANARERLRLAEGRYQTGVGSIIELGDAQLAATNAGGQRVRAEYELATARAQLLEALGRP
jgi:outer membrane protein